MRHTEALNTIKTLKLSNNGNFPRILSSDITRTEGEIMMTHAGQQLHKKYGLPSNFSEPCLPGLVPISDIVHIARDIISQLEIIHKVGLIHGDIRPQNICFNANNFHHQYSLVNFDFREKYLDRIGNHLPMVEQKMPLNNPFFDSDRRVQQLSFCRQDDLQ